MTTLPDHGTAGEDENESVPFLPAPDALATSVPPLSLHAPVLPPATPAGDLPIVPPPAPPAPGPDSSTADFDARAMVESQKRVNANPAYGSLPVATDESRAATEQLRAEAAKKRRRDKELGWLVVVLLICTVGTAGWFAYQAFDDRSEETASGAPERTAAEILDDLGSQGDAIDAQDALNEAVVPSAGGLGSAIDDAREAVEGVRDEVDGEVGGEVDGAVEASGDAVAPVVSSVEPDVEDVGSVEESTELMFDVVVPPVVRERGERLPDLTGRETYVIRRDEFAAGDPDAFDQFVQLMSVQPQLAPTADALAGLPSVEPDEVLISVERSGDRVERAIVVSDAIDLRVDVTP